MTATTRAVVLIAAVAVAAAAPMSAIQQAGRDAAPVLGAGTAVIVGTVLSDESSPRPVRRATVTLTSSVGFLNRLTVTDDNGRFAVTDLPAGRFTMTVTKPGWVQTYYGAKRAGRGPGTGIVVADGQRLSVETKLLRGAVIAGRIVDQLGQPQSGVRPTIMEFRVIGGERVVSPSTFSMMGGLTTTDDRGEYRIYGLPPGSYLVAATPQGGASVGARVTTPEELQWALRPAQAGAGPTATPAPPPGQMVGYTPVYYPGTTDMSAASEVTLGPGEERSRIDFALLTVPLAKVEGTLSRADGLPVQGAQLVLSTADGMTILGSPMDAVSTRTSVDARGRFSFPSIRPGRYRLMARAPSRPPTPPPPPVAGVPAARPPMAAPALDLYALGEVTVAGQDVANISLLLQPGSTISGRVQFETSTLMPPTDLGRVRIQLMPPISFSLAAMVRVSVESMSMASSTADGTFSLPGIVPGIYTITGNAPQPVGTAIGGATWMVKSVVTRGQNVADAPFEVRPGEEISDMVITFTDRTSEIAGTIFDGAGRPAPGYFIFVFPTDKAGWTPTSRRFRPPSQPSTDGKYRVAGLPPGEYFVAALTEFDQFDILDGTFLEQLTAASFKITLREGEKKTQDIKLGR